MDLVRSRLSIATASLAFAGGATEAAGTASAAAAATVSSVNNGITPVSVTSAAATGVSKISGAIPAKAALASGYHTSSSSSSSQAVTSSSSISGGSSRSSGAVSGVSGAAAKMAKTQYYSARDLTMWGMTLKVMREEGGVRGLYRGITTTAFGVAPYVGINFAAYEALRGWITPPGKGSVGRKLSCGALAGECVWCI